jgi:hemoglobin
VLTHKEVNEASIERLVRAFYGRARDDAVIGPIFNASVADWEHHIANITDFWSSIVLRTGRYGGRPMWPHLVLPLQGEHFDRWLMLFECAARELYSAEVAVVFIHRARRIADSFEMGIPRGVRSRLHGTASPVNRSLNPLARGKPAFEQQRSYTGFWACDAHFCVVRPPPNTGEHRKSADARLRD